MSMQASLRMKAAAIEHTSFNGSEAETTMLTSLNLRDWLVDYLNCYCLFHILLW